MAKEKDLNGVSSLWKRYKATNNVELRNELMEEYFWIVKHIAIKIKEGLPDSVELDDLISDGVFGLMYSIDRFDISRGVKFSSFSSFLIRNAIFDGLREMDWIPLYTRSLIKKYDLAKKALGDGNGKVPTPQEIANYFKISLVKAKKIERQGNTPVVHLYRATDASENNVFIDFKNISDPKSKRPEEEIAKEENFDELISFLSKREKIIIRLYYRCNYKMKQIGDILGLSKARISEIHSLALQKLKKNY